MFKKKKKDFIQQFGTVTSPLRQHNTILEIIPWTQNVYTLLYQPRLQGCAVYVQIRA